MTTQSRVTHLDDEALILHYYGEDAGIAREAAQRHLAGCELCRDEMERLGDMLAMVSSGADAEAPEGFERVMWARVSGRLAPPTPAGWRVWFTAPRLALAGGMVALVAVAFVAGRFTSAPDPVVPAETLATLQPDTAVLLATREHLERAQMTLAEVLHADAGGPGLAAEGARAAELVAASRLIRQSMTGTGESAVADVLDDLERALVEIANRADGWSPDELDAFKARLDAGSILFRLRVIHAEMSERRSRPTPPVT